MEDFLNPLRELLKYSLAENYKIDRNKSPSTLSIVQDYSFSELCDELRFIVETLLTFKKNAKMRLMQKEKLENKHICLTDLPSYDNSMLFNNSLKRKLKKIQEKYVMKVQQLVFIPKNETDFEAPVKRKHCRRSSTFRSINSRHSGFDKGFENERKILGKALASADPKNLKVHRPRSTMLRTFGYEVR